MKYKHVIWDWNGTLLDDVGIAVNAMNNLLKRRGLPLLDEKTYKSIFTFPVKDYYVKLGFDFKAEPFEEIALEFIVEYKSCKNVFRLFREAEHVVRYFDGIGISQSILSASREKELNDLVDKFAIKQYFITIAGLNNHYAHSKEDRGRKCLRDLNLKPAEAVLIGDTIHDYEVAGKLGCDCFLIANGHQSHERLEKVKPDLLNSLSDLISSIA